MLIATASPTSTLSPTLASAYGLVQPRQTDYFGGSDSDCYNFGNGLQCTSILSGCYDDILAATDYSSAATACFCTYGISYLDCFYSQIATGTCASYYFGSAGYGDYQRSYYSEYCGSIPPDVMAQIEAPTSVSLDFEKVDVVRATGAIRQPDYDEPPQYQGEGELLKGACSQTDFTLVDGGNTVYYGGFVGCVNDRPECCPWAVATPASVVSGSAATNGPAVNARDNIDFPSPVNNDLAVLASCADDYYSISGGCCPNGFWPFTRAVGGITPCWSSISTVEPPTLTLEKDATTKEKPTSAVVNIVWSMRFEVADPGSGGLSTAAKAGIGAGAGVAAILIAGLAICLWRSRRKNKKLAEAPQPAAPALAQMQQQQQQPPFKQPQMMPQANVPNGQYPPGAFHPGMAAMAIPPSDRTSTVTSGTSVSPGVLVPQHTGTSGGGVSELSSQGGQNLHNAQPSYFAGGGGSRTDSPAVGVNNGHGYPAPIAEADEGQQQQHYPQYGYQLQHPQQYPFQPQQQQQQPQYLAQQQQQYYGASPVQQMPPQGQGQGPGQYYAHPQAGYAYPQQQQPVYSQNVPEMSANREADPPQEVMGSRVQQQHHAG
ncbi:uncharacterized protein B0H64DRAFT_65970 [Chaetomium fimeti]|uniref:Uncharacterized protein n=1 Tax=Chaetomium fimeti TaxID=1854472 RepID=A0AAE0HKB0_9PEZI|nr:hypothetical protein B0H64DRAFT_65970 [Chaetomium fimeti]